eukprot:CAMPEP_0197520182 /NCGR_PEP_ID=MMETSP1318-20131121/5493_1 /TAXON_ID=552666 /ORGANISM="Partenskyella glossopodia, Strain RCC365" /LENGTH=40 /DNA_ID= /DNA_START= /DNA_END= /DNA_ORIENTATION=
MGTSDNTTSTNMGTSDQYDYVRTWEHQINTVLTHPVVNVT